MDIPLKGWNKLEGSVNRRVESKDFTIRMEWRYRMTMLKHAKRTFSSMLPAERRMMPDKQFPNITDTAACSRFKTQLKRAFDSAEAPQYLIEAIKTGIRS